MKRKSRSELFLLELIIVILVFAISAAACTSVLARAYVTSRESRELDFAVRSARSCTELMKAWRGDTDKCAERLGGQSEGVTLTVYSDGEMAGAAEENAAYSMTAALNDGCRFTVSVSGKNGEIYSLESALAKEAAQ